MADSAERVSAALEWLKAEFSSVKVTDPYLTEAEGEGAGSSPYLNCVAAFDTLLSLAALRLLLKDYETQAGRRPEHKAMHTIPIDLDAVIFNGAVVDRKEYTSGYFRRGLEMLGS